MLVKIVYSKGLNWIVIKKNSFWESTLEEVKFGIFYVIANCFAPKRFVENTTSAVKQIIFL